MKNEIYDKIKGKKVIIFGAGYWGQEVSKLQGLRIDFLVDNDRLKGGEFINNYPIYFVDKLEKVDISEYVIIISVDLYYNEILSQLATIGFSKENIIFFKELPQFSEKKSIRFKTLIVQITTYCNSKCVMCGIWKEKNITMKLNDFEKYISQDIFSNVEALTFTGGELTLVDNFNEYVIVAIKKMKALNLIAINTNAFMVEKTIDIFSKSIDICKNHNIEFILDISIDGINEYHDLNRGIKNGFYTANKSLQYFIDNKIQPQASCTITKYNIWNLDELLLYFKNKNVKALFRLAEKVTMFSNLEKLEDFAISSYDEIYQGILFFYKLIYRYDAFVQRNDVYQSYINILLGGKKLVQCPFQTGIGGTVDITGDLSYCTTINAKYLNLNNSCSSIDKSRLNDNMVENKIRYCSTCLRDHSKAKTAAFIEQEYTQSYWRNFYTVDRYNKQEKTEGIFSQYGGLADIATPFILITGWYGTETVGDKAILGQIINECKRKYPNHIIKITSIYPFITERTLYELKETAQVVPLYDKAALIAAMNAELVIMGGGPLMEMELLAVPLWLFRVAKSCGKSTMIRGCGIGPVYNDKMKKAVKELLLLADEVSLRDAPSCRWALENAEIKATLVEDPAVLYLADKYLDKKYIGDKKILACFLREITTEYSNCLEFDKFEQRRKSFEKGLAENIKSLCKAKGLIPHFYSMHNFAVGNDDRDFNFRFTREYFDGCEYFVENKLATIDTTINAMISAEKSLCMRFHSNVFAQSLSADYIGIDYTDGGKVMAFAAANGKKVVTIDEIISDTKTIINL